jgi:TonB-linked SusC/RagA family outer membrane protein
LIGSISSVTAKDISAIAAPSVEQALQGRAPGVIVTNNGSPGEAPLVRIRGISSINFAGNPLYVVDGIPQVGSFTVFDSKDIQSMEILKDAASSAIYGSRAAAGVILITTKRGSNDGKIHVNIDSYVGVQNAWKQLSLLNTDQYVQYGRTLETNAGSAIPAGLTDPVLNSPIYNGSTQTFAQTNTNWQKEMFQSAAIQQHQISISGGNDKSKFYSSLGYFRQDGIMLGTGFERYNARINSEHKIGKRVTFGQTFLAAYGFQKKEQQAGGRTQIQNMIRMTPYITVLNPNNVGGYNGPTGADGTDPQNPVRAALQDLDQITTVRLLGSAYFNVEIMKWLTYRFNLGIDYTTTREYIYQPIYSEGFNGRNLATLNDNRSNNFQPVYTNQLTFDKTYGKHTITATGVLEYQTFTTTNLYTGGNSTSNTVKELVGLTNASINGNTNIPARSEAAIISNVARLNYEYAGKYLLSASIRRDGASSFAPGHKYGNFPSVGLGWRINEESFMKSIPTVSELKLRASYGTVGNIPGLTSYPYQSVVSPGTQAVLGGQLANGSFYNQLPNANYTWETTKMTSVGLDLGLLENKVTFTAEYYYRNTSNLVLGVNPPPSSGYSNPTNTNIATMNNSGVDIQLGYRETAKELKWNVSGNIGFVQNQVTALQTPTATFEAGGLQDYGAYNITNTQAGHPVQSFYGFKTNGIFQNAADAGSSGQPGAAAGDIRFVDTNKDGTVDANDRVYLGNVLPNFTYGLNFSANYKGWDFSAFLQGVQGNKIYNGVKVLEQGMLRLFNSGTDVMRAWTPTNTNTDVPRAISGDPNNNARTSNRFIEDGSYMRLKNLTIGYSVSEAALRSIAHNSITRLRVYFAAQNLFTITKYTGYDPEIGWRNNTQLTAGIDYGQFPQARTLMFGVQIGF